MYEMYILCICKRCVCVCVLCVCVCVYVCLYVWGGELCSSIAHGVVCQLNKRAATAFIGPRRVSTTAKANIVGFRQIRAQKPGTLVMNVLLNTYIGKAETLTQIGYQT